MQVNLKQIQIQTLSYHWETYPNVIVILTISYSGTWDNTQLVSSYRTSRGATLMTMIRVLYQTITNANIVLLQKEINEGNAIYALDNQ